MKSPRSIEIPKNLAREALDAMTLRARWYLVRGCDIPEQLGLSIAFFCSSLDLDVREILGREINKHLPVVRRSQ